MRTETENLITKVEVNNLTVPIKLYFPGANNQNLTNFLKQYTALSSYRFTDRQRKKELLDSSGLSCIYWDTTSKEWSTNGC